jgi:ABC-type sugar transport system substrate-binding protein
MTPTRGNPSGAEAGSGPGRRGAVLALSVAAATALAACGGGAGGGGGGGGSASHANVKLATITASTTQNAFQEMADGSQAAAQQYGVSLTEQAPNGVDPEQEVQMLQAAAHTAPDGIAYMATAPDVFVHPTKQVTDQGVPVVAMDAAPLPGSGVQTLVANDNVALGAAVATELIKKIPPDAKGEVVIGNDIPGLPLLGARIKGMIQVLKAQRPNVTIVGPFNVGSEPADNYNHWSALVKAHPTALAYMEPGDQGPVSFKQIAEQTGKHYLVAGCDVDPTALQAVKEGDVDVLGDPHHFMKGFIATALLARHAIDKQPLPQGWWNSGSGIVTAANIDQILAREQSNATRYAFYREEIQKQLANPPVKPISEEA